MRRVLLATLPPLAGLLAALFLGALVVLAIGKRPDAVFVRFLHEFAAADAGEVIYYGTILTLTGLSVAYAFQAGLFNIGGEGQLLAGGFAMGIFGAALPAWTPWPVALPATLLVGFAAGAAWAAVPAVMRTRFGAHEVITTILMNLIATGVAGILLQLYRKSHPDLAEAMHTLRVVEGAQISPLEQIVPARFEKIHEWIDCIAGSHANTLVFLALAVAAVAWWTINRTRTGFELRAVGANENAAHAAGISLGGVMTKALLVSGGLAGLAAAPLVLADKHYYSQDLVASSGFGFTGIAVAVLAGNDPFRVVLSAFLMAFLTQAGEVVNGNGEAAVPKEIVLVLQAVVIVSVLVSQGIARRLVNAAEARRARRAD